jgi:hypothetical protein
MHLPLISDAAVRTARRRQHVGHIVDQDQDFQAIDGKKSFHF